MSGDPQCFGVLRIGNFQLALDVGCLREVVFRPEVVPLPAAGRFTLGAIRRGGHLIPLVSLTNLLLPPDDKHVAVALAVVVRSQTGELALAVDEIVKVARLDPARLCDFQAGGESGGLFPRVFHDEESGAAINVLDPDALLRIEGVRHRSPSAQTAEQQTHTARLLKLALFEVGGRLFGIDVSRVRRAIHAGELAITSLALGFVLSYWKFEDTNIPVLNLLSLLGLRELQSVRNNRRALLIEHNGLEIALAIDDVRGAIEVPETALSSLEGSGMPGAEFYGGILQAGGEQILLLNAAALLAHENVRTLAVKISRNSGESAGADQLSFVVYESGRGAVATALRDIEAIVPLPEMLPLGEPGAVFRGAFPWRGNMINVLDLGALFAKPAGALNAHHSVLIVRRATQYYGFAVASVESLELAAPRPAPSVACGDSTHMIQLASATTRRNVNILDLSRLVESVASPA